MDDMTNFGNTAEARDIRHHFHGYTNAGATWTWVR